MDERGELTHTGIVNVLTGLVIDVLGGYDLVITDKAARQIADALIDDKTGFPISDATVGK